MKKKSKYLRTLVGSACLTGLLIICSCRKLVDVDPPVTSITNANVFNTDANAISVLTGLYADLSGSISFYSSSLYLGLYADEFTLLGGSGVRKLYYQNQLSSGPNNIGAGFELWNSVYPLIYRVNEAITGISNSTKLSAPVKQQLLGEAKFTRAFYYFYLTNLYGDLPLILSTDYSQNGIAARAPQTQVLIQVKADLLDAQSLLTKNFTDGSLLFPSADRFRPTYWAATALLARYYLYTGDWVNADTQASILINNNSLFTLSSLNSAFKLVSLGNQEAIWQLQLVNSNNADAATFYLTTSLRSNQPVISNTLLNSFETGDQRKTAWIKSATFAGNTYYFPTKYQVYVGTIPIDEGICVFRLAEQYLIRAEARANGAGSGLNGAVTDLNAIRSRAGLPNYTGTVDKPALVSAIIHERQVELFSEQGHRWFDLKRTGLANTLMPGIASGKGGAWSNNGLLFPIPYADILNDSNLKQNPGY